MRKFKSLKAAVFYRLLISNPLNYRLTTNKGGSHKILMAPRRLSITFTWHTGVEISGNTVKKILIKRALLTQEEAYKLVHKIK